jgi:hypothetical protein
MLLSLDLGQSFMFNLRRNDCDLDAPLYPTFSPYKRRFIEQTGKCKNKAEFTYEQRWQNILLSVFNTSLEFAGLKWHNPKTFSGRLFSFAWLFARLLLMVLCG